MTTSSMTYDVKLRLRTATNGDGITLTYDYDDSDRVSKITAPDSTFETYEYLGDTSLITEYTDRAGRESTFTYDANGNRLTATDPELNLVQFDYDANGQLTKLTDAKNNETAWQYDVLGRTIRKDYDDGNFEQYFYDAANQLTSYRQPNASVIAYEYDTRGNVTKVDYPSMADVTFTYDNQSRVVTMTDALGTTTNAYDLMSRPTSSGGLWANDAVTYDYDTLGRRDELGLNSRTVTFGYDNLSRLDEVNRGTDTFTYTYKANGSQLDEVDLPNGAKSTFNYDGLGRLTQIQDLKSTAANISKFAYGYDNRDVKTHVERALGTATTQRINYTYDDIDQLLTEISTELTPVVNNNFTYDAAQNRTASSVDAVSSSFTINTVNQISAYTLGGSPITVTHDDNGNTTQLGPKALTWDDANRLTRVTVPGVSKSEYQYDGLNRRRIAKAYTWNSGASDWDLQSERRFIYDGMDLIEERDGSNALIAFYTRDGNIGGVLSRTTSSATFYYHYDGNGNVVSLSDASENVVAEYAYDAYGNVTSMSGAQAADNPLRFSTKYFDGNTGYYDYGFRSYDPVTGRWLNRDPIGEEGGLNLYGFVGNSPINGLDAFGLDPRAMIIVGDIYMRPDPEGVKGWIATHLGGIGTALANRKFRAAADKEVSVASKYFRSKGYDVSVYRDVTWREFFIQAPRFQALFWIGHSSGGNLSLFTDDGGTGNYAPGLLAKHLTNKKGVQHKFDSVTLHSCFTNTDDLRKTLLSPGGSWWGSHGTYDPLGHRDVSPKRTKGAGLWRNFAP